MHPVVPNPYPTFYSDASGIEGSTMESVSKKISPETAVYTLKELYSLLFIIQKQQQMCPQEKKKKKTAHKKLRGGGRKGYTFLSFYLPVETTQLKETVSLPAVCSQRTSSSIRGYTLSGKCFPVKVKLWSGLLCYLMGHTNGTLMSLCSYLCCVCVNIPVRI